MELVDQLAEALNNLPERFEVDAEAANEMARQVRDYTTRENPNKTMVQISTSGLRLAIQKLAADIPKADDISLRLIEYAEKLIS